MLAGTGWCGAGRGDSWAVVQSDDRWQEGASPGLLGPLLFGFIVKIVPELPQLGS